LTVKGKILLTIKRSSCSASLICPTIDFFFCPTIESLGPNRGGMLKTVFSMEKLFALKRIGEGAIEGSNNKKETKARNI